MKISLTLPKGKADEIVKQIAALNQAPLVDTKEGAALAKNIGAMPGPFTPDFLQKLLAKPNDPNACLASRETTPTPICR